MPSLDYTLDPGASAIGGGATPSVYDTLTGGIYPLFQDPWTAADNGTIVNSTTGAGTAPTAGTVTPPPGGSSNTPASWLSFITGLSSAASQAYTTLAPVIGGSPARNPAQAGQSAPTGAKTITVGGSTFSIQALVFGGFALLAVLFLWNHHRK